MPLYGASILILLVITVYIFTSQAVLFPPPVSPSISFAPQNGTLSAVNCIDSHLWCPHFVASIHCRKAITAFYIRKVSDPLFSHVTYEFLAHNIHPTTRYPIQNTPERYVWRTCTMALVLVADVPALNKGRGQVHETDLATYFDVWDVISGVLTECVMSPYEGVGRNRSATDKEEGQPVGFRSGTGWGSVVSS